MNAPRIHPGWLKPDELDYDDPPAEEHPRMPDEDEELYAERLGRIAEYLAHAEVARRVYDIGVAPIGVHINGLLQPPEDDEDSNY